MASIQMQARSSSDGQLYTWIVTGVDFAGSGYTGPGSAQDVAVAMHPATTSVGTVTTGTAPQADFLMRTNDPLTGLGARDGFTPVNGSIGVFVGQTTSSQNGYWSMSAGAATRPSFYDSDAEVSALRGATVFIINGTLGGGHSFQQITGTTLAGAKTFKEMLGNPDTVIGEQGSVTRLGHDVRSSIRKIESGSNYIDVALVQGAAASVLWSFDAAGLGFSAKALLGFAANIYPRWPSDDKSVWAASATHWRHETVTPILVETRAQQTLDGASGANNYIALTWALSGTVIQLKGQNLRASGGDCIGNGVINFFANDTV